MRRTLWAAALLFALPLGAAAQSVKLPATLSGKVGEWILVPVLAEDGGAVQWYLPDAKKASGHPAHTLADADPAQGLSEVPLESLFGPEWAMKAKGRVFKSDVPGRFRVVAYCAKGDVASPVAVCTVVIGDAPPPGPIPPGPGPADEDPFDAAAGPGLKVLVVVATSDLSKLPAAQLVVLNSTAVRAYLTAKCAKDGTTPAYRIWDRGVPTTNESPFWQHAFAKVPQDKVPYVLVGNGKSGYAGPLPATVNDTIALLTKFGG